MDKARNIAFAIIVLLLFGIASASAQAVQTVTLRTNPAGGMYLADSKGLTLYWYTKDTLELSNCYGGCEKAWPVFYAPTITVSAPLKASDFSTITRTDGTKQTVFRGWPLYYYQSDLAPGDLVGEGRGSVWYVIDPAKFPVPKM